jgi:L-cysteine S-thiosulfotransferase
MIAAAGRMAEKALLMLAAIMAGLVLILPHAAGQARKSIPPQSNNDPLRELISGYEFAPLDIRALQDDDFDNPGFGWVTRGEALWSAPDGTAQKSCASCHKAATESMRGKAVYYPKFLPLQSRVINLEERINICRGEYLGAEPWAYGSNELLGMTAYLRLQSRGLPTAASIDGEARTTFEKGRNLYNSRMGQLGMSCALCHDKYYGHSFGGVLMSQGHSNGFPTFRQETKKFLSLHEQLGNCYGRMKAEPQAPGSPDDIALELYLAWRGAGLPLEAPSVRR